ncbi:hypothetical protein GOQ27_05665 [Clostridium sp. D2Q-11]|uniref:Uncharacterized protein n=1 Tax=Anaeromonas frigoriresistens TaxID=2683708 RepID=A0A942Z8F6_9FIRM|nr:hypothetical protein [Anaeromonas frigoriresistens]MBS4537939.1 hypothetical protein [Anaeromonas frigoriresistens]
MKLIFLILLIIPVGFFQLIILSDIINTSKALGKANTNTNRTNTTPGYYATETSKRKRAHV